MNAKTAYTLLETLMDGVNPITGELLPEEHVCQEPAVLRALHKALAALRAGDEMQANDPHAGRAWTQKDDAWLRQLCGTGASMEEMCHLLQRRKRGIERRMVYLGLSSPDERQAPAGAKWPRAGKAWTAQEEKQLREMWQQGAAKQQMAKALQRSPYAIQCRLERLGMLKPEDADRQPQAAAWSMKEAQQLRQLYASGSTADEIAARMNRPVESIRARMFYMGLTREAPISLHPPGDGGKAAQENV